MNRPLEQWQIAMIEERKAKRLEVRCSWGVLVSTLLLNYVFSAKRKVKKTVTSNLKRTQN